MSLNIKDGNGSAATLKTTLDSSDHVPHHRIDGPVTVTSSLANPLAVTGTVYTYIPAVTTVTKTATTSFAWNTAASGSFNIASESISRKGLTVFNPGPHNLYLALSTNGSVTHGFTITSTSSAPTLYTTILYPSGTYIADPTTVGVYHAGYFISGSSSVGIFTTSIA